MRLSLIIPAYNEEKVIENTIQSYIKYFKNRIDFEIIPIVEGTDRSIKIVKNLARTSKRVRYKTSKKRLGKGGAVLKGFKLAKGELIGFVDADMATKPDAFNMLLKEIRDYDVVIASRNVPDTIIINNRPLIQRFGSWGFNSLVKLILRLNIKDTQCGAKLFRKEVINQILNSNMTKDSWAFDVELLYIAKKGRFSIKEVPTIWEHREEGSKFNFNKDFYKIIPKMFMSLLKVRKLH